MLVLVGIAWGCAPTAGEVARARAAYDDAEVESAGRILEVAVDDLGCQTAPVDPGTLLELYRLDGLVALSRMNEKAAVYATIRAVTVDPDAPPPPAYGPELFELHRTWADRLRGATATLVVDGGGTVWVDGNLVPPGARRVVVQGEHLIQVEAGGPLTSDVRDVTGDLVVHTGLPGPAGVIPDPVVPTPIDRRPAVGGRVEAPRERRRPAALWVSSAVALGLGAGVVGLAAWQDEVRFPARDYRDEAAVDRAASQIRTTYVTGYALLGVGGGLLATSAVGLPVSAGVGFRW